MIQRPFDHFADQCNFGLAHIETTWVLSLDADYKCDQTFANALRSLDPTCAGYRVRFLYAIYGRPLRRRSILHGLCSIAAIWLDMTETVMHTESWSMAKSVNLIALFCTMTGSR